MNTRTRLAIGVWAVMAVGLVAYAVRAREDAPAAQAAASGFARSGTDSRAVVMQSGARRSLLH